VASYYGKRLLDLTLSLVALTLALPVLLVIGFLVWMKLGWPILFRQERPGLHGKPFTLLKFRTMTNEKDANGNLLPAEERVTPFGQFLRSTSLDELPELFNVLRGDMSLIGPRPLLMQYLELYTPEQMRRHEVRPGITGWAQVNGRNQITWEEKFALDVWYVDHISFKLDMKILLTTIRKVLRREGIGDLADDENNPASYFRGTSNAVVDSADRPITVNRHECQLHSMPDIAEGTLKIETHTLKRRVMLMVHRYLNPRTELRIKKKVGATLDWVSRITGRGHEVPAVIAASPPETPSLQAGDRIRVRSEEEIRTMLDRWNSHKGCVFMQEMLPYCGTTQRVLKPVRQFLDERDYRLKKTRGIVLLKDVICEGTAAYGPCDRACFFFWREEWLEKLEDSV
jgi:sugar transferase EpsL